MRYYEIMFLVRLEQADQIQIMIDRYKKIIEDDGGKIYRLENLGKRQLAYPINKFNKAYYVLLNIECKKELIKQFNSLFRFNDAIIRSLIIQQIEPIEEPSCLLNINKKVNLK